MTSTRYSLGPVPEAGRPVQACRFCNGPLSIPFCNLGATPLANSYVEPSKSALPDPVYPLEARVCERCWLVQLSYIADARAIFSDYAYFSSYSSGWLAHAADFAGESRHRLGLGAGSFVVEVGSNDGYLLKYFVAAGIACLGVEPAANVAAAAVAAGVPTAVRFFGLATAEELVRDRDHADLVIANNVLAHVPDINDFVAGLSHLAGPQGVVSIEVPHVVRLVEGCQFDTIYHEHYAYWSLLSMEHVLEAHGLKVFDVQRLRTHGGSLRVWATASPAAESAPSLVQVRAEEASLGVDTAAWYTGFEPRVKGVLEAARSFLGAARRSGRQVAAYGAAAKGNTFLNALGATSEDIEFVADRNPSKQGRLLPGSRIPVLGPEAVIARRPDFLLILPWNIADEVASEMSDMAAWGGRFVVAVPELRVFEVRP